ncbi:Uncharacterized protein HZ326_18356 [Fusarium oxysporum f. sp. albedinis]|nr:Uncharacterized protein HZ326_18356 [Fusarium oxysporum f. sp. albedinis]
MLCQGPQISLQERVRHHQCEGGHCKRQKEVMASLLSAVVKLLLVSGEKETSLRIFVWLAWCHQDYVPRMDFRD